MIKIEKTLVSEDILDEQFVCDLSKCRGACCVEGESGAPLENHERFTIQQNLESVKPFMSKPGLDHIDKHDFYEKDEEGDLVTQCINERECVFAVKNSGIWTCSIEKAWENGKVPFRKPVSCHLYPVRITKLKYYTAVNYDRWDICSPACELGKGLKIPVYKFLRDALIRKFGESWYQELELVAADIG